ncbi:MAG: thiamine phosphate synthase [Chitinophagales bacterium]|nr:thiamine phosphate synthase [Chitinophagales bacterium]
MISKLHVITQDLDDLPHIEQVELACKSGAKWIQLRIKDTNCEKWRAIAKDAVKICRSYGAKLIINDSVQMAIEVDADGVHLGKDDMPIHSARALLGKGKIIGGTGSTIEDIMELSHSGADYAVIGPYKYTPTKKNMNITLGLLKYKEFVTEMKDKFINFPIIAIGGIHLEDVPSLLKLGVYGVAVSSAIFSTTIPGQMVKSFQNVVSSV